MVAVPYFMMTVSIIEIHSIHVQNPRKTFVPVALLRRIIGLVRLHACVVTGCKRTSRAAIAVSSAEGIRVRQAIYMYSVESPLLFRVHAAFT
jgi:hypothetical protein